MAALNVLNIEHECKKGNNITAVISTNGQLKHHHWALLQMLAGTFI